MQQRLEVGANVFIIESNRIITKVVVAKKSGDFYTVRFPEGGAIQLRRNRLFLTKEEAEKELLEKSKVKQGINSPHDYAY